MAAQSRNSEASKPERAGRRVLVEDKSGKLWIYSLNMDMMIHGGEKLPPDLYDEANEVKDIILDIMNRGAEGDF